MAFETRISDCKKYILVIVKTEIYYDLAVKIMRHAYNQASKLGIRNYYFDVRSARNIESTSNNYRLVNEDASSLGYDRTVKIALLIDLHDDSHDFIETAAASAGLNCKIFTCEEALLEWVQI